MGDWWQHYRIYTRVSLACQLSLTERQYFICLLHLLNGWHWFFYHHLFPHLKHNEISNRKQNNKHLLFMTWPQNHRSNFYFLKSLTSEMWLTQFSSLCFFFFFNLVFSPCRVYNNSWQNWPMKSWISMLMIKKKKSPGAVVGERAPSVFRVYLRELYLC